MMLRSWNLLNCIDERLVTRLKTSPSKCTPSMYVFVTSTTTYTIVKKTRVKLTTVSKDKDDYEVTLRPEMTPSLARLIIKQGGKMLLPIR